MSIALKPRMSEKAYGISVALNTYVFEVPATASKAEIISAVSQQFKVTVEDVRVLVLKGKTKKSYRKGGRPTVGKRVDVKKAYVRVKAGDKISIFGEEEKAAKEADKATKKTAAKPKKKEAK